MLTSRGFVAIRRRNSHASLWHKNKELVKGGLALHHCLLGVFIVTKSYLREGLHEGGHGQHDMRSRTCAYIII